MLNEDFLKSDIDEKTTISFSVDTRLDTDEFLKLAHIRYAKHLVIDQNDPNTNGPFYTKVFKMIRLKQLSVHLLEIYSKNFEKTKQILKAMRDANITMLKINFEDEVKPKMSLMQFIQPQIKPSHVLVNVSKRDLSKFEWIMDRSSSSVSTVWFTNIASDVNEIKFGMYIKSLDNVHVRMEDYKIGLFDSLKNITNLYVHVKNLSLVPRDICKPENVRNLILECDDPKCWIVKLNGKSGVDVHITQTGYKANKKLIKYKSIVLHEKLPKRWAKCYEDMTTTTSSQAPPQTSSVE